MVQVIASIIVPSSSTWFEITDTGRYGLLLANAHTPQIVIEDTQYTESNDMLVSMYIDHGLILTGLNKSDYSGYEFAIINPYLNIKSLTISGGEITDTNYMEKYGEAFVDSGTRLYSSFTISGHGVIDGKVSVVVTISSSWNNFDSIVEFELLFNSAPVIDGPDNITLAISDEVTTWQYTASDFDGDMLQFSIDSNQNDIEINSDTGVVSWNSAAAGYYSATVIVSDGIFEDRMIVEITVQEPELPEIVYGCMDSTATNYEALATESDASCIYEEQFENEEDDNQELNDDSPSSQGGSNTDSKITDDRSSKSGTHMTVKIVLAIILVAILTLGFIRFRGKESFVDEYNHESAIFGDSIGLGTQPYVSYRPDVQTIPTTQQPVQFAPPPPPAQPTTVADYTGLPPGGSYDQSTGQTIYIQSDGLRWQMMGDGSFNRLD